MAKVARKVVILAFAALWLLGGLDLPATAVSAPKMLAYSVSTVAGSRNNQFVGAVGGSSQLFVGFLNGTVVKMDPVTGTVTGTVLLPDGNSAAHLAFYNGSLFVGTEYLHGAKDTPPYHVYKISPADMVITGAVQMNVPYADGFVVPIDGYLWAGDGHCTLYKINPGDMQLKGVVADAAEDEMLSDGVHYWGECRNMVNVMTREPALPTVVASGSLSYPNRPRGFFMVDASVYASGTMDYVLYSMSIRGSLVLLSNAGTLGSQSLPTRDTMLYGGLLYTYQTGCGADSGWMASRVVVYSHALHRKAVIPLPGPALPSDASQHTLFVFGGRVYFVTQSTVGYIVPPVTVRVFAMAVGGPAPSSSSR